MRELRKERSQERAKRGIVLLLLLLVGGSGGGSRGEADDARGDLEGVGRAVVLGLRGREGGRENKSGRERAKNTHTHTHTQQQQQQQGGGGRGGGEAERLNHKKKKKKKILTSHAQREHLHHNPTPNSQMPTPNLQLPNLQTADEPTSLHAARMAGTARSAACSPNKSSTSSGTSAPDKA